MERILIISILCIILCLSLLIKSYCKIDTLKAEISDWKEQSNYYETKYLLALRRYNTIYSQINTVNQKIIPKGTTKAVKEAMKRAHPDNGGNPADFEMYRRAYNILTGKEKMNV